MQEYIPPDAPAGVQAPVQDYDRKLAELFGVSPEAVANIRTAVDQTWAEATQDAVLFAELIPRVHRLRLSTAPLAGIAKLAAEESGQTSEQPAES